MIAPMKPGLVRVSMTLDPVDVDLIDRLAALEGSNRSAELRSMLEQLRPMLTATVQAFESAARQRDAFDRAASAATIAHLEQIQGDVEALERTYIGAIARLEGAAAADSAGTDDDGGSAPASNTGATE